LEEIIVKRREKSKAASVQSEFTKNQEENYCQNKYYLEAKQYQDTLLTTQNNIMEKIIEFYKKSPNSNEKSPYIDIMYKACLSLMG
jgi:uncharacterized FlgJ-related protein